MAFVEILLVNSVFAAAFWLEGPRKRLLARVRGGVILQAGNGWLLRRSPRIARRCWCSRIIRSSKAPVDEEYFQETLRDLTAVSLHPAAGNLPRNVRLDHRFDLIVWPNRRRVLYQRSMFRDAVSALARSRHVVVAGDWNHACVQSRGAARRFLIRRRWLSPGEWLDAMTKCILFLRRISAVSAVVCFCWRVNQRVGEFQRAPRTWAGCGAQRLGTFICYDRFFPTKCAGAAARAQVLVNISNDGWYGQWRLETALAADRDAAIENDRWLLSATNTGRRRRRSFWRIAASTIARSARRWLRLMRWFPVPRSIPARRCSRICVHNSAGALIARYAFSTREEISCKMNWNSNTPTEDQGHDLRGIFDAANAPAVRRHQKQAGTNLWSNPENLSK